MIEFSEALSPWGMKPARQTKIFSLTKPFDAIIDIPGSKSFTNRALILAAIAEGKSVLRAPLFSDDSYWCTDALSKLGVNINVRKEKNFIEIEGVGKKNFKIVNEENNPYIGSAGTIARFLPGILAAKGKGMITLTSSEQLAKRPIAEMIMALRQLGANINIPENKSFPMEIEGGTLIGGDVNISGKLSSQFISGLLIAAPLAQKQVRIHISDYIVQSDYVKITLELMKKFGVAVQHNEELTEFLIEPQQYIAQDIALEADASTSTYFFALAAATRSKITIRNLDPRTNQPDFKFIDHLKSLGCIISEKNGQITLQGPEILDGNKYFDFNACSDSTPALAGIAPFTSGTIEIRNIEHIRGHECDRISVMCQTLKKANVKIVEHKDGLTITPVMNSPENIIIDPHDDHRMAMSFSVMAAAGNGATILDPSCVSKTCPNFFNIMGMLGVKYVTS